MEKIEEIYKLYDDILKFDIWYLNGGIFYPRDGVSPDNLDMAVRRYKEKVKKLNEFIDEVENLKKVYAPTK